MSFPTRRRWPRVLAWTTAAAVTLGGLVAGFGVVTYVRAAKSNLGDLDFANQLRVPPLERAGSVPMASDASTWTSGPARRSSGRVSRHRPGA